MYEGRYEDYIARDLVSYVDKHYSTRTSREFRYIGGASMGGYAAFHVAFRNPELFSKVGGHAPALWTDDYWDVIRDWMYPAADDRIKRDPVQLATIRPYNTLSIHIDTGELDEYRKGTQALYDNLIKTGTKSATIQIVPGGKHDEAYWSSQAESYLLFYGGK
ncbi:putative esterase [compost metagenome]